MTGGSYGHEARFYGSEKGGGYQPVLTIYYSNVSATAPTITFDKQIPNDISGFSAITSGVNVSYNVTDTTGLNTSNVKLYYSINTTRADGCMLFVNGTCLAGNQSKLYQGNNSVTYDWNLADNQIYPATYPLTPGLMENTTHNVSSLMNQNQRARWFLYNVSNNTAYNYLEFMVNRTTASGTYVVDVCNSTSQCGQLCSISTNTRNHTHYGSNGLETWHMLCSMNIINGSASGVKVTPDMEFRIHPLAAANLNMYYISAVSRQGQSQTTTNAWTTSANLSGTFDSHLHQFENASGVCYWQSSQNTAGLQTNSTTRCDLYSFGGLAPDTPTVTRPLEDNYTQGNLTINWTAYVAQYSLSLVNVTLWNSDLTFNQTLNWSSANSLYYLWDMTSFPPGAYYAGVQYTDSISQPSGIGYSANFTILSGASTTTTTTTTTTLPASNGPSSGFSGSAATTTTTTILVQVTAPKQNSLLVFLNTSFYVGPLFKTNLMVDLKNWMWIIPLTFYVLSLLDRRK